MDDILVNYIINPDSYIENYNIAKSYQDNGEYSAAISFYIRCKEKTSDILIQYECILKCTECFRFRGKSDWVIKSLLDNAVSLQPRRPESYFLLSRFHGWRGEWEQSYEYATLGISNLETNLKSLGSYVEYDGIHNLLMRKAISCFYLDMKQEYRDCFKELFDNYFDVLSKEDRNTVLFIL